MNRGEFKRLAELRLREAEALLRARHFSGAYYLGGYAIECALKACIAKKTRRYDFPEPPNAVRECYSHDLIQLVRVAGLNSELEKGKSSDPKFEEYWRIVTGWSEQSRYEFTSENLARDLLEAISDPNHGVLQWVTSLW
jgi:HEPN domain-containing protein